MTSSDLPIITDLPVGWEFPSAIVDLSEASVARYNAAVGQGGEVHGPDGEVVAPSVVATLCIHGCLKNVILPERTLHIGQDIEMLGAPPIGEVLDLRARIRSSAEHSAVRIVSIDMWATIAGTEKQR